VFTLYIPVTVHLGIIPINNQLKPQFLLYIFISILHTGRSPTHSDIYQMLYWYNWLSWWWAQGCSKHVESRNYYYFNRLYNPCGFLPTQLWLSILSRKVFLQSAVASGTSNRQLGGPVIRTFQQPPQASPSSGRWNCGREVAESFAERGDFHVNLVSFTCRKVTTCDRRLYFPSEGRCAEEFFARKIRRLRPGLNTRTRVPEASTLPLDNRRRWVWIYVTHMMVLYSTTGVSDETVLWLLEPINQVSSKGLEAGKSCKEYQP
jgi:hypothetical protein